MKKTKAEVSELRQKLDGDDEIEEDLPTFSNRSAKRKSADGKGNTEESKVKRTSSSGRNIPKEKLGTIEEDDSEQKATISPSQAKLEESKVAAVEDLEPQSLDYFGPKDMKDIKAGESAPVIPSLNLDKENLRQKITENMK